MESSGVVKNNNGQVKDYKSFKTYVEDERNRLKVVPLTTDNGPIRDTLKQMGIEFTDEKKSVDEQGKEKDCISFSG